MEPSRVVKRRLLGCWHGVGSRRDSSASTSSRRKEERPTDDAVRERSRCAFIVSVSALSKAKSLVAGPFSGKIFFACGALY